MHIVLSLLLCMVCVFVGLCMHVWFVCIAALYLYMCIIHLSDHGCVHGVCTRLCVIALAYAYLSVCSVCFRVLLCSVQAQSSIWLLLFVVAMEIVSGCVRAL